MTPTLRAGDCLLYKPKGVYGWIIAIKTWHPIAHCECYVGHGKSVASRDGIGVGRYDVRLDGLAYILRPRVPFGLAGAMDWFYRKAAGQKYDWIGLLRFAWRSRVVPERFDNRQFCSEFLARFYRAGGLDPFNGEDADAVAPSTFLLSPYFQKIEVSDGMVSEGVSEGRRVGD